MITTAISLSIQVIEWIIERERGEKANAFHVYLFQVKPMPLLEVKTQITSLKLVTNFLKVH